MKLTRTIIVVTLALVLTAGAVAFAQSNNYRRRGNGNNLRGTSSAAQSSNVPGPSDYDRFSAFITQRNIFDPSRYPHNSSTPRQTYTSRTPRYAPTFRFVGTMSYSKGLFAFFDGNNSDLRKVLSESGSIAGYTVTAVATDSVTLQSADKKQTLHLKIGDAMRQEGSTWQLAGDGESFESSSVAESETPSTDGSSGSSATETAPSPALEGNDVLKKLMQQREQELK